MKNSNLGMKLVKKKLGFFVKSEIASNKLSFFAQNGLEIFSDDLAVYF